MYIYTVYIYAVYIYSIYIQCIYTVYIFINSLLSGGYRDHRWNRTVIIIGYIYGGDIYVGI